MDTQRRHILPSFGIIRIWFNGYDLSLTVRHPLMNLNKAKGLALF